MPLAFLLDENVPGRVWRAIVRHNVRGEDVLDVCRIGDAIDLPLGAEDAAILQWAEREHKILVTEDKATMPGHLENHRQAGHQSPGVFLLRPGVKLGELVEFLTLVAYASAPDDWRDRIEYVP
jgi:hypothetical protein